MNEADRAVLAHLEAALGPYVRTWDRDANGSLAVPLVEFAGPYPGARTISTLGLSRYRLRQTPHKHPDTDIREELLWGAWSRFPFDDVLSHLTDLAQLTIRDRRALLRGECHDFGEPLVPGTKLTGLYIARPIWYPDELMELKAAYPEPVVFIWALAVSGAEAEYGRQNGWEALERLFEQHDPDMFDLNRPSVI